MDAGESLILYTIRTAPYLEASWLRVDDEDDVLSQLLDELRRAAGRGRLELAAAKLDVVAELEGADEHYSADEIAASMQGEPLPYDDALPRCVLVDEAFVRALERVGAAFCARPIELIHRASGRQWSRWLVTYPIEVFLPLLRDDDEPIVVDRDTCIAYHIDAVRRAIEALGWPWLTFMRHALPRCRAVPAGDGPETDRELVEALGVLFLGKRPRARAGCSYDAGYFIDRLRVKYADLSAARLRAALDRTGDGTFHYELAGDELDGIAVVPASALARKLR